VAAIAAGDNHSLVLMNDSTVLSWGFNNSGQLGDGTFANSNIPEPLSISSKVIAIAGGGSHSLAITLNTTVWAWGRNNEGQLGNGNNLDSNVPVQVTGLCVATEVNEITRVISVSVFPNPSRGHFQLTFSNMQSVNGRLEIYNVFGEKILQQQLTNEFDLSDSPKGIYLVKIHDGEKIYTQRIVVQ
jgi:hypothetical protein